MSTQSTSSQSPVIKNASRPSSSGHSAQIYPQPTHPNHQRQAEQQQQVQSGGLLYNNLIPGHYRYGAAPPAPPVGPLSYSNISSQNSHQRHHQQQHQMNSNGGDVRQNHHDAQQQSRQQQHHQYNNVPKSYSNIPSTTTQPNTTTSDTVFLQVSEPDDDDDFDDDLLVIASSDMMEEIDLDDETYYKPFRHLSGGGSTGSSSSSVGNNHQNQRNSSSSKRKSKSSKPTMRTGESSANKETAKPMDLLAVLLSGPAAAASTANRDASTTDDKVDITILIQEASTKSSRARSMTNALVLQEKEHSQKTTTTNCAEEGVDNDLYVATANAHTEAAISFQILYKKLLGLKNDVDANQSMVGTLSTPSEELAKSMILLANGHARTAKSLGEMGVKWNMGKVDKSGRMVSKSSTNVNTTVNDKKASANASKNGDIVATSSAAEKKRSESESSNERLRMAVRGALEIVLEDDITNSTFLARSTVLNANKKLAAASSKVPQVHSSSTNNKKDRTKGKQNGENPVDDLMKLEKELRSMDMALEMGNSVASLGTAVASRPNNDLLGGSYMSSSSMWTSGIFGGRKPNAKQQQGVGAGVRSRANHLQHLSGGSGKSPAHVLVSPSESKSSAQQQQQGVQITPNASLDQSWWGGGGGQGSILASSAITTAAASHQRTQPTSGSNQANNTTSTNAKQLMQLMDSLNRLGNENAQLMREVEKAKAARAEAEAAKQVMAQFKSDYNQRFNK
eukprot:scaffold1777_cov112-Skeletonema_dohrnii-CCMP3373.AAC.8